MSIRAIPSELYVLAALSVYAVSAHWLNFIQDDAYITYRYVANYLDGHGLVYNIGERVEGFTNFGWLIYLAFWGALGADYILLSKVTGFVLGGGVIILTYLTARLLFKDRGVGWAVLPLFLVAFNQSLAYWSPAGLETAAFAFLTHFSVYAYLKRSRWLLLGFLLLVLVRPEGALVTALLILAEWSSRWRFPLFTARLAVLAFVLSIPFVVFTQFYYGGILPNPFYAKVGWSGEQLTAGVSYVGEFLAHYGFLGAALLVPVISLRKLSRPERDILLFTLLYLAYVVVIGGDVLKVHRFCMPVIGLMAILVSLSVNRVASYMRSRTRRRVLPLVILALLAWTFLVPKQMIASYNAREKRFVGIMKTMARSLKQTDSGAFSVAISTIGAFGFELQGHTVIDMLGLTDSTIARHPQVPVAGMKTTWREHRHNSQYLLDRAPNYILFSTGLKPSSPAEQTLLLYREFQESYRAIGWVTNVGAGGVITAGIAFRKVRTVRRPTGPVFPVEFVSNFKRGLDQYASGDFKRALGYFQRALATKPQSQYPELLAEMAFCLKMLGQHQQSIRLLSNVMQRDSLVYKAHELLYQYHVRSDNPELARVHERWLKRLVPGLWPWIKVKGPT